jgi:hypothetical protein
MSEHIQLPIALDEELMGGRFVMKRNITIKLSRNFNFKEVL